MADTLLFEKVYGAIAASRIASSMGANCEGWSVEQIEAKYGRIDRFLPLKNCANYEAMELPPGTTEDGIERQKFMCLAIRDAGGRITAQDLARAWRKYGDPEKMKISMGWWDVDLYKLADTAIPASEIARFMPWPEVVSFARSCHPIGLINACDPRQAALDAMEISRLYTPPAMYSHGPEWAAAVAAAIAEAVSPESTLDSVIQAATAYVSEPVRREILDGIALAGKFKDVYDMRQAFNEKYNAVGLCCAMSMCPEIVTKGLSIFYKVNGDPVGAILGGVNFGRDTDCTAAVAAGIAGAFKGIRAVPNEWIATVDQATKQHHLSVSQTAMEEDARWLYDALLNESRRTQQRASLLMKAGAPKA